MKVSHQRASALLITLAFVVLVTILVLGVFISMRLDRQSSRSHFERARADLFAQQGVESVIAALRQNTADTNRYWISQPGQLIVGASTDDTATPIDERKVLQTNIPLSSGLPSAQLLASNFSPSYLHPPNLNIVSPSDPTTHAITDRTDTNGATVEMPVKWIYIRRDGTWDKAEQPDTLNKTNPIVGRFAYWADDESSKVNYNTAWGRFNSTTPANTNSPGHPTQVELTGLEGVTTNIATAIHRSITDTSYDLNYGRMDKGFYNTPLDARRADSLYPGVAEALRKNKFEVTHYSHDSDTTFFGQPRIVLTTLKSRADGKPFLDLGVTNAADLQYFSKMNTSNVATTVDMLRNYLKRSDWPMVASGASSFQSKYYGSYAADQQSIRLTQLALNIIDYVRSKESPAKLVPPLRGSVDGLTGKFTFNINPTPSGTNANNVFIGLSRSLKITEVGVYTSSTIPANKGRPFTFKVEVHLPRNYGIDKIDLNSADYGIYYYVYAEGGSETRATGAFPLNTAGYTISKDGILEAGQYATIRVPINNYLWASGGQTNTNQMMQFRTGIYLLSDPQSPRLDLAPMLPDTGGSGKIVYYRRTASLREEDWESMETDDPRINVFRGDWVEPAVGASQKNTFDQTNSRYSVGKAASTASPQPGAGEPELDTDDQGNISDASLYMPPPAGTKFQLADGSWDDNTLGMVTSVGELGYITTGLEGVSKAGIPWRTLRLQPSKQPSSVVPDWALMDLFTVPRSTPASAASVLNPHGTSVGGRINLNSKAEPFNLSRTLPLVSLLLNAHNTRTNTLVAADAQTLANNIYDKVLSPQNAKTLATGKQFGWATAYDSPGEIVEIKGVADRGEASEALVRDLAGLISARGEVFTVFSIGQALRQTPDGKLAVTAEKRLVTMVEQFLRDIDGNPATPAMEVKFKPLYMRPLTP